MDTIRISSAPRPARRAAALALRLVCLTLPAGFGAAPAAAQVFQSQAPQAMLFDTETGSVLYQKGADEPFSPGSLVKLMTLEVVFRELRESRLTLEAEVAVSNNAWRKGGIGSRMFVEPRHRPRIADLISGTTALAGNDAAIVLAEAVAGSEEKFTEVMTERAKAIGLSASVFKNASGLSAPGQVMTLRDITRLSDHLIRAYPDQYGFFALPDFTWNKIKQQNRNPLLIMNIGADGLMPANSEDGSFALAGSAVQSGQRLIVAVAGLKAAGDRAAEARKLLDWGFRSFERRKLFQDRTALADLSVFGGVRQSVPVTVPNPVEALVPRGSLDRLTAEVVFRGPLPAPIRAGDKVGTLRVMRAGQPMLETAVVALEDVEAGALRHRAYEAGYELVRQWLKQGFAAIFSRDKPKA